MKDDNVFIQVQAKASQREQLKRIADDRGVSMSVVVRGWIKQAARALEAKENKAA